MICLFCMNSLLEGFARRCPARIPMAKCTIATGRLPSSTSSCRLSSNCGNHFDCSPALFNAIAPPSPLIAGINSKCKKDNLQLAYFYFTNYYLALREGMEWGARARVTKSKNFPDSKIFVAKNFRIKRVNCIIFQIRDKYA